MAMVLQNRLQHSGSMLVLILPVNGLGRAQRFLYSGQIDTIF
jgi:hypothetical protein